MGLEYLVSLVEVAAIPETPDTAASEPMTRKLLHEGHRV
jgi:hypothetical protein